jgi:hypothetical protein
MKQIMVFAALIAVFFAARPSFALVDAEVYGGYSFKNNFDDATSDATKAKGWAVGLRAHLTGGNTFFDYGAGAFYQRTPLKYKESGIEVKYTRDSFGPDAYLRIAILPLIKPYGRIGMSVYDKEKLSATGYPTETQTKKFSSYYFGFGAGIMPPLPGIDLMIFAEYLYNKKYKGGKSSNNTINAGVSLGF